LTHLVDEGSCVTFMLCERVSVLPFNDLSSVRAPFLGSPFGFTIPSAGVLGSDWSSIHDLVCPCYSLLIRSFSLVDLIQRYLFGHVLAFAGIGGWFLLTSLQVHASFWPPDPPCVTGLHGRRGMLRFLFHLSATPPGCFSDFFSPQRLALINLKILKQSLHWSYSLFPCEPFLSDKNPPHPDDW